MSGVRKDDPCPCGSGKKYKDCCFLTNYEVIEPEKKVAYFTLDNGSKTSRMLSFIDSIPRHNKNGLEPDISVNQMMDLCLDEIHKIIVSQKVGMVHDLVDRVIHEMDIVPTFTYRQIAERMLDDGRFEVYQYQICSLKGTNPVDLIVEKLRV